MKAIGYRRVSTEEQTGNFSLPTQAQGIRAYAIEQGYDDLVELEDDGQSGFSLERPALETARELVRSGEVAALIAFDVDRLSRRLSDLLVINEECDRAGVRLLFVRYPTDPTAEGFLFLQMRGAFAEYERKKIDERMNRGRMGRAQGGEPPWGYIPFGYRYVKGVKQRGKTVTPAHWQIVPEEAQVIREMFQWLIQERLSIRAIVKRLAEKGVKPHKGGIFSASNVHKMFTGVLYGDGRVYYKDIPIDVPAIVDPQTVEAAKARLKANKHAAPPNVKRQFLLTGRIFCALCGKRMAGNHNNGFNYYRCPRRDAGLIGYEKCGGKAIRAEPTETWVWDRITQALQDDYLIQQQIERQQAEGGDLAQKHSYEIEIKRAVLEDLDRRKHQWDRAYEMDAMDLTEYKQKRDDLKVRQEELNADIAELERRTKRAELNREALITLREATRRLRTHLGDADLPHKKLALEALDVRLTVLPGGQLELTGNIPLGDILSHHASESWTISISGQANTVFNFAFSSLGSAADTP